MGLGGHVKFLKLQRNGIYNKVVYAKYGLIRIRLCIDSGHKNNSREAR
jgi:hypothetical protein